MRTFQTYLAEATDKKNSEDKLKHLEHAEDHPINAGVEGYQHAAKTLHAVHHAMQGKPSEAHTTTKYDGSPSIVFGHHPTTGKFFVASKSAFNANPKINYTPEDIEANHGHAPGLVAKLKAGLKHLPKVVPDKGVYQGDVMHTGTAKSEHNEDTQVKSHGDDYHFKPNTITYTVPKKSPEGQKVAKSKFGVVVHTQYNGKDLESMKAGFKPDAPKSFKEHPDVHVVHPNVDATQSHMDDKDHKKFEEHMNAAEAAHQTLMKKKGYDALAKHTEHLKTYINKNVAAGTQPTHEGYMSHIEERGRKDIEKLKSEKGKAARQTALDMAMKQAQQHKPHIEAGLQLHHHLQSAKDVLVHGLEGGQKAFGTQIGDKKSKGEGFVTTVNGRPTKLVDRAEFSRANFERGAQNKKKPVAEETDKHHVLAFGRMNPITSGHEAVINKVKEVAKEHKADHTVVVSHSQDKKKNPLTAEQKVTHAKNAFGDTNIKAASKEHPTILHHAAELHKQGVQHLHVVAGSDRQQEMHDLLHKYNGKDSAHGNYNFKSITVHSSGARDPDAEGTTGISASKMREHAAAGNEKEFHKGAPSKMSTAHKKAMYKDVRKGMGLQEQAVHNVTGLVVSIKNQTVNADIGKEKELPKKRVLKKLREMVGRSSGK